MGPKTTVPTYKVNGLEVSDLNGKRYYSLPDVYTQKIITIIIIIKQTFSEAGLTLITFTSQRFLLKRSY